jgi:hypothetical protein
MRLVFLVLSIIVSVSPWLLSGASAQGNITANCLFVFNNAQGNWTYDLSGLSLSAGNSYTGYDEVGFGYLINVCGPVFCTIPTQTAGVCQCVNGTSSPYHNIGFYNMAGAVWAPIDANNATRGIKFSLANGDACPTGPRTANIYFDCVPGAQAFTNMTIQEIKSCNYDIHFPTGASCPTPYIPPPTPAPLPSGGSGGGLSGGSIFLIIFFVFSFVYVAGGCIYRRVSFGVHGMEACPHYPFWSTLPGLVSDGFRFFIAKLTCRDTGTGTGYEDVK